MRSAHLSEAAGSRGYRKPQTPIPNGWFAPGAVVGRAVEVIRAERGEARENGIDFGFTGDECGEGLAVVTRGLHRWSPFSCLHQRSEPPGSQAQISIISAPRSEPDGRFAAKPVVSLDTRSRSILALDRALSIGSGCEFLSQYMTGLSASVRALTIPAIVRTMGR